MKTPRLVGDYHRQYPTWGDLAREQVRRRGYLYLADVAVEIRAGLNSLPPEGRQLFALICAERLLRRHERLAPSQQRAFTLGWRPVLNRLWDSLSGEDASGLPFVQAALEAYSGSPVCHSAGPDGPDDADEEAAAACIYAAQCFVGGEAQRAEMAADRARQSALSRAQAELQLDPNDFEWSPDAEPMPLAKELMHPVVQQELRKQLADLRALRTQSLAPEFVRNLRQAIETDAPAT